MFVRLTETPTRRDTKNTNKRCLSLSLTVFPGLTASFSVALLVCLSFCLCDSLSVSLPFGLFFRVFDT